MFDVIFRASFWRVAVKRGQAVGQHLRDRLDVRVVPTDEVGEDVFRAPAAEEGLVAALRRDGLGSFQQAAPGVDELFDKAGHGVALTLTLSRRERGLTSERPASIRARRGSAAPAP